MNNNQISRRHFLGSAAALCGLGLASKVGAFAQPAEQTNEEIFVRIAAKAQKNNWKSLPIGKIIVNVGKEFLSTPYVAGSIECGAVEKCIISLRGLDCVTFFESSLCIARAIRAGAPTYERFAAEVEKTRYRNGTLSGYDSRLHYTSDWIFDNESRGIVKNITQSIGGAKHKFKVGFMSANPKYYPALVNDPAMVKKIESIENAINERDSYLIPIASIKKAEKKIETGDIIAIATSKAGLDYSHTGLACVGDDGLVRFMHASTKAKKVILDKTLHEYVQSVSSNVGIAVVRAV